MDFFEWVVQTIRDVFHIESLLGIALLLAAVGAIVGGTAGYIIVARTRAAEGRRLVEMSPDYLNRYVVAQGAPAFRIDTLDQDLRKVGIAFTSISSPQAEPSPGTDTVPQEYFRLGNGLYLRTQWRNGTTMPTQTRALAERVILAHESRLKTQ